jgi:hypothetical protein
MLAMLGALPPLAYLTSQSLPLCFDLRIEHRQMYVLFKLSTLFEDNPNALRVRKETASAGSFVLKT